jgi:hypothetical protein
MDEKRGAELCFPGTTSLYVKIQERGKNSIHCQPMWKINSMHKGEELLYEQNNFFRFSKRHKRVRDEKEMNVSFVAKMLKFTSMV